MPRRILLMLAALLVAATATLLTQRWLGARLAGAASAAPAPGIDVLVAARTLEIGTVIAPGMLRWARWPTDGAYGLAVAGQVHAASYVGSVVRSTMIAGEPVTAARLVQPGARGPMAAVIAPGARAVTINVTAASGMAGFVIPGDRVDLLLTQTLPDTNGSAERHLSQTVLQNVRVLGTDQHGSSGGDAAGAALGASADAALLASNDDGPTPPSTVTLEVTPKGAELIAVAAELGKLSLSLRSLVGGAAAAGVTWDTDATHILPRAAAPAAASPVVATPPAVTAASAAPLAHSIIVRGIEAGASEAKP